MLILKRTKIRKMGVSKDSDAWLNINENLFKTELTAGDAICWRILKWFLDGEEFDDDYLEGKQASEINLKSRELIDEI